MKRETRTVLITRSVLRRMPVGEPAEGADKEGRGRVLVVGGSAEMPGAVLLAGVAALRAGAGKVRIATVESVSAQVAAAFPEARVYALPESKAGGLASSSARRLAELAREADSVCVGPGMIDRAATTKLLEKLLPNIHPAALLVDADALASLSGERRRLLHSLKGKAVITPNADEMEDFFGGGESAGARDALAASRRAAREFRAVVALKGRETFIAAPDGRAYVNRAGNVGLATSGSGDVLAGLIAGLCARGAEPLRAAVWGVRVHAVAGDLLARRVGPVGFLARELLDVLPRVLWELAAGRGAAAGGES